MKVAILCGGKGTRMREETEYKPKPLVEIGGMPILWHIMKTYSYYGFNDFVLCLGYKGNMIKDYFMNFEWFANDFTLHMGKGKGEVTTHAHAMENWNITFADTGEDTDTGGRVKKIEKYIDDDVFFLTYGDGLADVNISNLLSYHHSKNKIATVTGTRPQFRFGVLEVEESGIATSFAEKPSTDGLINGGFYVLNSEIFSYLLENSNFERDALPKVAKEKELAVYEHRGFWKAIDTYKEVEAVNEQWNLNNRPWVVWEDDEV
ncbi:MAG: Bifunctional protein GlmU [Candidatus Argoarchaeum ethanivorans]|uniref:Bifunctional protein GlmU n=1 Tax=Candidatus Argoarchaeum ethanivorans TaxID=2608793 RepID=A0A811TBP6_9EURY|nr:MAG: Bifunctional protein GlmU [Candidatus Argoarchaeum ethanivorans]